MSQDYPVVCYANTQVCQLSMLLNKYHFHNTNDIPTNIVTCRVALFHSEIDEDVARSLFVGGLPRDDSEESSEEMRNFLWEVGLLSVCVGPNDHL